MPCTLIAANLTEADAPDYVLQRRTSLGQRSAQRRPLAITAATMPLATATRTASLPERTYR